MLMTLGTPRQPQQRAEDRRVVAQREAGLAVRARRGAWRSSRRRWCCLGPAAATGMCTRCTPCQVSSVIGAGAVLLAVHGDPPAARHQVQRQALGKGLEAAVGGRHAARAQDASRRRPVRRRQVARACPAGPAPRGLRAHRGPAARRAAARMAAARRAGGARRPGGQAEPHAHARPRPAAPAGRTVARAAVPRPQRGRAPGGRGVLEFHLGAGRRGVGPAARRAAAVPRARDRHRPACGRGRIPLAAGRHGHLLRVQLARHPRLARRRAPLAGEQGACGVERYRCCRRADRPAGRGVAGRDGASAPST
jgi:hypothetical protein